MSKASFLIVNMIHKANIISPAATALKNLPRETIEK